MRIEKVPAVIIGSGPAGLAAGYTLAQAQQQPLILEKAGFAGGLMRSISRGDFIIDIGRKELYDRLARVDAFWNHLLGDDYRPYPHRGGILFDGRIIEISPAFRGVRRGMPWSWLLGCAADLAWPRLRFPKSRPINLEQYFYQKRGRRLSRIFAQGFQEKLSGVKWADVPLPDQYSDDWDATFFRALRGLLVRAFSRKEANTSTGVWRHPAKGTGQICQILERGILKNGGRVVFGANVTALDSADGLVTAVIAEVNGQTVRYELDHLVSTIPAQFLLRLLLPDRFEQIEAGLQAPPTARKTVVLVYLFLDERPRFPHAWLQVTCPRTRIGRITNYSGISQHMVPPGQTCLCCEFFCHGDDPLLEVDDGALAELALIECAKYRLIDPAKCGDRLVLRLPGADASQNRQNWMSQFRRRLLRQIQPFRNLYYANRTDLDLATLAGIESAEAILCGERATFDRHLDPRQLDLRSAGKAFEFKTPAEQGIE
jgi:protoporphyrinogen oxidase